MFSNLVRQEKVVVVVAYWYVMIGNNTQKKGESLPLTQGNGLRKQNK